MKKLCVMLILLLIPIQIFACPHFDENGNLYLLYYDSEDYEITIIEYPKNDYHQLYFFDIEDRIIKEQFEIPFFTPMKIDYDADIYEPASNEPYYIELNEVSVTGEKFELQIKLEETVKKILPKVAENTARLSYVISTKLINKNIHQNIFAKLVEYTDNMEVELLDLDILYIGAGELVMDSEWQTSSAVIKDFLDPVIVKYQVTELPEDITILKIDSFNRELIKIAEIDFEIKKDYVEFASNSESYYMVVKKTGEIIEKEIANEEFVLEDNLFEEAEDPKTNLTGIILVSSLLLILFVGGLIVINKKQIKIN